MERVPTAGGAELLILRRDLPGPGDGQEPRSVPLLAVLRDTLGDGDPDDDRLRYIWSLTFTRPSWPQRVASALPFFYWRVAHTPGRKAPPPKPVLNLAHAQRPVWQSILGSAAQTLLLDTQGSFLRSSSRAYRGNASDHRRAHLLEAISTLEQAGQEPALQAAFTPRELERMEARLRLAAQRFGGLVSEDSLRDYVGRQRTEREEMRGHNWELLRQRVETERLLFQPLFDGPEGPRYALVSVAREDLQQPPARPFQREFLSFSDPWHDERLLKKTTETSPLALYALDHPRTPLLIADFRNIHLPRRREIAERAVTDVANGIVGVSLLGNWYYFAGRAGYDFVKGRHGAALDRMSRVRAYEELRSLLLFDRSLDPALSAEILQALNTVSINPLENDARRDSVIAQTQYQALLKEANNPRGLPARVERDRREEMTALLHGKRVQTAFHAASILSFGLYTHRETSSPELLARLGKERQIALHRQILREALEASPQLEVTSNLVAIQRSVSVVAESNAPYDLQLVSQVFRATADAETRTQCLRSLARNGSLEANRNLQQLARDPNLAPVWRDQTVGYLSGQAPASGSAGAQ